MTLAWWIPITFYVSKFNMGAPDEPGSFAQSYFYPLIILSEKTRKITLYNVKYILFFYSILNSN